jgi:carbon monoxide dehydrogenase subunit G
MLVGVQLTINAPKEAVWAAITNIEIAAKFISGIEKIEIVEKPVNGPR